MMMVSKCYLMSCPDNDSYWIPDREIFCCPVCGSKLTRDIQNNKFYLKKKKYDLSITYDGYYIASQAFRDACDEASVCDVTFTEIRSDERYNSKFYMMDVRIMVPVDLMQASPLVGNECACCRQPRYIVGAKNYGVSGNVYEKGIWRSDLEFAEGIEKSYVLYVGYKTGDFIMGKSLRGIHLDFITW